MLSWSLSPVTSTAELAGDKRRGDHIGRFKGEMGVMDVKWLIFITGFLLSGSSSKGQKDYGNSVSTTATPLPPLTKTTARSIKEERSLAGMPYMDYVTPMSAVPVFNPSNPAATTTPTYNPIPTLEPTTPTMTPSTPTVMPGNPYTAPSVGTPSSSSQNWCVASQSASLTALQVALDYACGYGGADCSEIQPGSSCFIPDTIRDHASYAFNSYYQKNPVPTSCDFGGTAVTTNVDPSTSTCQYPSTSTTSSVPNATPTGSTIYGSVPPPDFISRAIILRSASVFLTFVCFLVSMDQ